jgi:hypothetical protein
MAGKECWLVSRVVILDWIGVGFIVARWEGMASDFWGKGGWQGKALKWDVEKIWASL